MTVLDHASQSLMEANKKTLLESQKEFALLPHFAPAVPAARQSTPKPKPVKARPAPKPKSIALSMSEERDEFPSSSPSPTVGRRSSRRREPVIRYDSATPSTISSTRKSKRSHGEIDSDGWESAAEESEPEIEANSSRNRAVQKPGGAPVRLVAKNRRNPKVFGHIPGIPVGTTFGFRMEASQKSIHAAPVSGICGNAEVGAWSVALSGGYVDDVEEGYAFTFTGSGGRDLKGTSAQPKNLRTAPQSSDQTFTALNASLKKSVETGKPVRVLRGFRGQSCFAPVSGYRYDGLYVVTKAWQDIGLDGFKVCKFAFVRMSGQPEIPIQPGRENEAKEILAQFGKTLPEIDSSPVSVKAEEAEEQVTPTKRSAVAVDAAEEGPLRPITKRARITRSTQ